MQEDTVPFILLRNLCLRGRLRAEDALETFAVLQEDQNPQHASDQRGRDAARCHRQVTSALPTIQDLWAS